MKFRFPAARQDHPWASSVDKTTLKPEENILVRMRYNTTDGLPRSEARAAPLVLRRKGHRLAAVAFPAFTPTLLLWCRGCQVICTLPAVLLSVLSKNTQYTEQNVAPQLVNWRNLKVGVSGKAKARNSVRYAGRCPSSSNRHTWRLEQPQN